MIDAKCKITALSMVLIPERWLNQKTMNLPNLHDGNIEDSPKISWNLSLWFYEDLQESSLQNDSLLPYYDIWGITVSM